MGRDEDQVERGLGRLLVEEQEKVENEMRAGIAKARLAAGDRSVRMFEVWGDPYNRIDAIRDFRAPSGLSIMEAKAFVDAYKWDRARTIEAAVEYARGQPPRHLDLKPAMSTKEWLEIRASIEAEPISKPTAARRFNSTSTYLADPQGTPTSASAASARARREQ